MSGLFMVYADPSSSMFRHLRRVVVEESSDEDDSAVSLQGGSNSLLTDDDSAVNAKTAKERSADMCIQYVYLVFLLWQRCIH